MTPLRDGSSGAKPTYAERFGLVPPQREWQACPVCQGSGRVWDPIMGMGHPGATMACHRCVGTGTIERPR